MIDFRYHLVSIVAVFLALAIGIVLGSTELQGPAYNILNSTTGKLQNELNQASSQRDAAQQQADLGQPGGGSLIDIHINLGAVWARVVQLADPESSFSLESDTAVAVVHDGLPGGGPLSLGGGGS